ncbi:MAG: hypothetical protein H7326_06295 [Bdellovibrionaceae bacterium]|nr:hypothetical protein [Pseudobdellovibrionaceae bacterium]
MDLRRVLAIGFLLILTTAAAGKKKISDFKEVGGEDDAPTSHSKEAVAADSAEAEKPKLKDTEEILTGTVTVMRKITLTEAFFKELKDSYYIPSGSKNYPIFKAFTESSKKGTKVTFKANKKSRQVISMEDAPVPVTPANPATPKSDAGTSSKSGSQ